jgi:type IV fimbrial biogenesis protein FimT
MPRPAGYTLVECLICLALAALLATLAAPAISALRLDGRMTSAVNDFIHGLHAARVAAQTRGQEVALCRSVDGRRCSYATAWQEGYIVFINRDRDSPPQVDPGESLLVTGPATPDILIQANRSVFVFRPFGRRSVNGTLTFCDQRGPAQARSVIVSYTGRPRAVAAATSSGPFTCPR